MITCWDTVATTTQANEGGCVKVILNGRVIAESQDSVVVAGNSYFPSDAVDHRLLARSRLDTVCVWKGVAFSYHVTVSWSWPG